MPIPAVRRLYASLPPVYWTIWLGTLVNRAGGFVVPFLAIYITTKLHQSERAAGLVVSLYGGGTVLASLVGGTLTDRLGRRATMLLSLFGGSVSMLAIGFARTIPELGVATFCMGWVAEMYRPAVAAMIADVVEPVDRGRAYAYLYWVINLGYAIAPTLAGLVSGRSYLALFVVDATTTFLFGLIVLWRVPETRPAEAAAAAARGDGPGLTHVLRDSTFMWFVALSLGTAFVIWQNNVAFSIDVIRHGISPAAYGMLSSINGVMIVFLQPFITRALARRSRTRVLAVSSFFFGVGFGLYGVVGTEPGYALAIAVWTLAEIANLPTASAVVADLAPTSLRGRYQGMSNMAWGVASCLGPVASGYFLGRTLWFGCFGLMLLVTVGHVILGPARSRREI